MKRNKIKFLRQLNQSDCGITCIQIVLNYYGSNYSTKFLREYTDTGKHGTNASEIKKIFNFLNFEVTVIKANETLWHDKNLILPMIANLKTEDGFLHYVVVYKIKNNKIYIADPSKGRIKVSENEFQKLWTGISIIMFPNDSYTIHKYREPGILTFLPILINNKKLFIKVIMLSFLILLISILNSFYFKILIDKLLPNSDFNIINLLSLSIVSMTLLSTIMEITKNNLLGILGQKLNFEIISNYIIHLLKLPLNFFESRKTGDLVTRFIDAFKIMDALASATLSLVIDVTLIISLGVILLLQSRLLFLITLISLPLYFIVILYFSQKYERYNEQSMILASTLNSNIIETIKGIETVKSLQIEEKYAKKIITDLEYSFNKTRQTDRIEIILNSLKSGIGALTSTIVIWLGSILVLKNRLTLGELITYNSLIFYFTSPIQSVLSLYTKIQVSGVASRRLNEILIEDIEKDIEESKYFPVYFEKISVKNLRYSYDRNGLILSDLNFNLFRNEKIALIGNSGSGKTTFAKILLKYYPNYEGIILIDDINLNEISIIDVRRNIHYVPQDIFLFTGTILENLTYNSTTDVTKSIVESCICAEIYDFIKNLPLGFETKIEEGGVNLSGGQKKRIAIARALINDSPIIIFDEITNGLDSNLENKVVKNLLAIKDRTIIFISHSKKVINSCNRIINIEKLKQY